jgi:hypothetical protein
MKLTTKTLRCAIGGAALATILATAASAQSPSWPTPPAPTPQAQSPAGPQTQPASPLLPARLGQMLAPIALYPDDLLADVLAAATYPLDVVEAARWVQDPENAALKGDQLFAALQQKSWDPSVKSLTPFPRILRMLDANLEWTEQLGEAYLADPAAVIDAVQRLRRRAQLAGRLVTTPEEIVHTEKEPTRIEESITIVAPNPEVVYVPICDPSFAYGPWPYPDFPPFFPVFAGAAVGGCGWISGPVIVPFVLNFRTRHIEIDRKRLALFDRGRDRERGTATTRSARSDAMTPVTETTFPTAMQRSAPGLGAERQRRTSILLSACARRARLLAVPLRPRRRKSGSVAGWRAPDHCLTALLKGVGR